MCLPGGCGKGKRFLFLTQMVGHEGEGKEEGGRTMTGVTEGERDGQR